MGVRRGLDLVERPLLLIGLLLRLRLELGNVILRSFFNGKTSLNCILRIVLEFGRIVLEFGRFVLRRGFEFGRFVLRRGFEFGRFGFLAADVIGVNNEPHPADHQKYQLHDEHGIRNHGPPKLSRIDRTVLVGVDGREYISQIDVAVAVVVVVQVAPSNERHGGGHRDGSGANEKGAGATCDGLGDEDGALEAVAVLEEGESEESEVLVWFGGW